MAQQSYKKFVASAATATLVASALIPVASAASVNTSAFTDVSPSYKDAVEFVVSNNIASGLTATQFGISQQIKRGDVAIMIAAAAGLNDEKAPASGFSDVPKRGALAINSLKAAGVISGKTATKFGFEENVTRGEAALMLQKAFDLKAGGTKNTFTDVSDRYDAAVDALVANKVTNGVNATQFGTTNNIKRGDFAKFLFALKDQIKVGVPVETVAVQDATTLKVTVKDADKELVAKDFKVSVDGSAVEVSKAVADADGKNYTLTIPSLDGKTGIVTVNGVQADFNFGPGVAPQLLGVTAISATKAKATFKGTLPKNVDFSNFDIDGGLTVTDVKISDDRKSATFTVNPEFVRNQEYTVSVFGVMDADGKEYAETKGKFSWEVAEGTVVALEATTLDQSQAIGLTVKDAAGKDVKDAKVTVTSLNTNLVAVNAGTAQAPSAAKLTAQKLAGSTDVIVVTELPDGSKLTNTFKVTVKDAISTVSNAGYTLETIAATSGEHANTLAFKNFATSKVTSLVAGTSPVNLVAFAETNGNPDVTHIDFTDAKVTSSNAIVATAVVANTTDIQVTPLSAGTTTINVTLADGTRKSFPVTVTAAPVISDLTVSATNVKLSDENRTETTADGTVGHLGVDAQKVTVKTIDQYKVAKQPVTGSKVTVTSNTEGVKLFDTNATGNNEYTTAANTVTLTGGAADFYIQAQKNKPVSNAKVTVSYFKNATDATPTYTKNITVNVVDVKVDALTADIDVVAGNEIDANAKNITSAVDSIDFGTEVYALDSNGNRLENLVTSSATIAATLDANNTGAAKYVTTAGTDTLSFSAPSNALTYLRAASTVNVTVAVTETAGPSDTKTVTKIVPVTYKNTAVVPNKATVSTTALSMKLPTAGTLTLDEIIFGKLDADQLIKDDATKFDLDKTYTTHYVAPTKTAKNGGYAYNKSIVTILGTDGKAVNTGANLYGNLSTVTDGNNWTNPIIDGLVGRTAGTPFATNSDEFEYEYSFANISGVTPTSAGVTLLSGEASTFTLVLSGIYTKGSLAIESTTLGSATAEQKAKHNLLAAPVQLNVSVSAE